MPVKKAKVKKVVAKKPTVKNKKIIKKVVLAKKPLKKLVKKVIPVKKPIAKKSVVKKSTQSNKKSPIKKPLKSAKKEVKKLVVKSNKVIIREMKLAKATQNNAKKIEADAAKEIKVAKEVKASENVVKKPIENVVKSNFKIGEYAVYPSHGVGKITGVETAKILGQDFSFYLMHFEKEKLVIKIPTNNAQKIGLRNLATKAQLDEVFSILRSGVKKLKGMWSRRAQEYETKINSGDIILLAEVLRDLIRDIEDGDRSYSERIIYETAINRLASEYSAVHGTDFEEARQKVITIARDKLVSEVKVAPKDDFDDFDGDAEDAEEEIDEDEEEEGEEDEDYDDEDDDKPKKKRK